MLGMTEITLEQAREIAVVDHPENPRGVGAPYVCGLAPFGAAPLRVVASAAYRDPQGRGAWILVGDGHLVPCPRRVTECLTVSAEYQAPG